MCGFVGYLNDRMIARARGIDVSDIPPMDDEKTIRAMADRIRHRGPDDASYYVDDTIALGFRRLSIIDLSGGRQPILNEDRTKVLVFNGEIYNYRPLREELVNAGHVFTTNTDSEVLLHGYEEWGKDLLQKIRGMYAFCIWDNVARKLFGARDIFGIKPFYYYMTDGEFMFASEVKSFLSNPRFDLAFDESTLPDWMCYEYLPDERTMLKDVYKLPGAHYIEYDANTGELSMERYYTIPYARPGYAPEDDRDLSFWEDTISATFRDSVEAHMIADVEVGCFLSSGVDSSYVVNEVAKAASDVKTFSVGYEEEKYSELSYAQEFSATIGVPSIANKIGAEEYFDAIPDIMYFLDEPLPNPSEVPLYFLAQNAARYVKVVLSGEGADELFGGYPMYLAGEHFDHYAHRVVAPVRSCLGGIARHMPDFKGKHFLVRGAMEPYERFMRANYVYTEDDRMRYLSPDIASGLTVRSPCELSKRYFDETTGLDESTRLQYVDMHTWMAYDILLKADRMSMANSLELRVPFLDRPMLEMSCRIPQRFRAHDDVTKVALRATAGRELPAKTANRPKLGFPVPLNDWMREDRYATMIRDAFDSDVARRYFDHDAIMALLDEHLAGKNGNMKRIWMVYSFVMWYDQFFNARREA